jgi:hypothetical protein
MKILLHFIFLFTFIQLYSQNNLSTEKVEEDYQDYFALGPENIFTHINKTIFFKDESLWFKTYIYDTKNQKPYNRTMNVYVSIFNNKGILVIKKLLFAQNGQTHGYFKIDDAFSPGIYFLKTSTNWMKNFNEDHSYIQKFEVLGEEDYSNNKVLDDISYDFQLLPEGGYIVSNVENSIGIKIINNNGESVRIIKGELFDNFNNKITSFKSNRFGLGKFKAHLDNTKQYEAKLTLEDGTALSKPITEIRQKGVTLNTENTRNDILIVNLNTNKQTLPLLLDKDYYLLIHRDGLINKVKIKFKDNQLNYIFSIPKKTLLPGINILTLFNDKSQPIAERMIFNHSKLPVKSIISINNIIRQKDSSTIILKTIPPDTLHKSISISVLPSLTKSYSKENSTIKSTFFLSPYLKGHIENPRYYFQNSDRKTLYDLDLLLMTQGWSKYSWSNIFYKPHKLTHAFETGFSIKGKINNQNYKKDTSIYLLSIANGISIEYPLRKDNSFNFENLFLADSTEINFTKKNENDKLSIPKIYYILEPKYIADSIKIPTIFIDSKNNLLRINNIKNFIYQKSVLLDTIVLKNKNNKPKNKPFIGSFDAKYLNFSNNQYGALTLVTDVLRNNGYDIEYDSFYNLIIKQKRPHGWVNLSPVIFINNMRVYEFSRFETMTVDEIEEMFISRFGIGLSFGGANGGVINIYTKIGQTKSNKKTFNSHTISFGFSIPKTYYSPLYDKTLKDVFTKYGVLNWLPNLTGNEKGEIKFNIPNYLNGNINLYIEGMRTDGSLISTIEQIRQ